MGGFFPLFSRSGDAGFGGRWTTVPSLCPTALHGCMTCYSVIDTIATCTRKSLPVAERASRFVPARTRGRRSARFFLGFAQVFQSSNHQGQIFPHTLCCTSFPQSALFTHGNRITQCGYSVTDARADLRPESAQIGDYVDIKVNPAQQKGMPYLAYQGRTGVVWNVTPRAVGVEVNKQVRFWDPRVLGCRWRIRCSVPLGNEEACVRSEQASGRTLN